MKVTIVKVANFVMNMSEGDTLRYLMYWLYLCGDSMLATKTALVAFFGEFMISIVKVMYKEPRPYWVIENVGAYRCEHDFEGPSDHTFIVVFIGTYLNLIYLRKYARKPKRTLSMMIFIF